MFGVECEAGRCVSALTAPAPSSGGVRPQVTALLRKNFRTWDAHLQRASYISSPEKNKTASLEFFHKAC
jgi:hypothetical protein